MIRYSFPDGAHYRIEVSGIESADIFLKTAKAFKKASVPWHRAICCVRGAGTPRKNPMMDNKVLCGFYEEKELREFAKIGADFGIEVIMTPFTRPTYQDSAIQAKSPQGIISGMSWRGQEALRCYFDDIIYLYSLGFRGFLVWRKSMLNNLMKRACLDYFPKDIVLKLSVFDGNANPADANLVLSLIKNSYLEEMPIFGVTMNPVTDLTVEQIGEIRHCFDDFPLDIHSRIFESWGGNNRIKEVCEIVKAASPVYFKDEPGPGLEMYRPDYPAEKLLEYKLSAVETARQIIENINKGNEKYGTDFKISDWAPKDLYLPKVG
ncbi:MAG: hypothetical protein AAB397_02645 [Patescibacteria group bacterium]